ncbi:aldo/keto reductase [Agrobacterium cavarae]|uniref:aldo/keto reductase n=1 Tax=Agrobacterium cavarae TaxID=2528239 RepID=UPI0028969B82|nr:aldo/keto reductase [Agrobacterium cavarae]
MQYRRLGQTSLKVSALSLGTWLNLSTKISGSDAHDYINQALEAGVNLIDTAESYEGGDVERLIGDVLSTSPFPRDAYCICTKIYFGATTREKRAMLRPTQQGLSRKHILEGCDASLHRLQTDYIDILLCHRYDPDTSLEELAWTMHSLVLQGKILYWGTSEWPPEEIERLIEIAGKNRLIGPSIEQPQLNVVHRDTYKRLVGWGGAVSALGLMTWSPLASGILSGRYGERPDAEGRLNDRSTSWVQALAFGKNRSRILALSKVLTRIAGELQISPAQLAVAWCLKQPMVSTVIIGGSTREQLVENLGATERVDLLTADIMQAVENAVSSRIVENAVGGC